MTKKKTPIQSFTVGAFPLLLVTHIFKDGSSIHTVSDGRLPPDERTETLLSAATFSRLVAAASAEALTDIALFIHNAVHGDSPAQGETIFESKKEELS